MENTYTQADEVQEWGLHIATHCFHEEATCASAELAESQSQERKFMSRAMDHFAATYSTLDLCQCCLLKRVHLLNKALSQGCQCWLRNSI